ncbi:pyruvate oxidase [Bifidobacterium actinocoloniiforme DSM 22766]|uniref:Pyruvate oxidase n=1 Tax=Bifidobacterium actinocoloniiforme DSM 22766 TaxID=1437605 RepID=A0A086Z0B6_9BIFI|nr:pyruvate oxidase [Bifidobacterium actinocoloniiforme]AKV55217.1 pyruvate oxidase [Bifidobacterium actinocoloniiforme DSM 22766]KFI39966.1 pyruvate oxidase [Bifidobacterium actinocoloniiforme DSM 22766]
MSNGTTAEGRINAGDAVLRVLEQWGVPRIYGLPGGSFDSMMNALHNERERVDFIQVRHEEAGAIAAAAEAKLTGRIGVCFGSSGPGAAHLLNGLYDAREDGVPVLALVGEVPQQFMNTDFFQAMDEVPMFTDVAVFDKAATNAQGLPVLVDEAIRRAYKYKGVSVVIIPKDLAWDDIVDLPVATAKNFREPAPIPPRPDLIQEAVKLVQSAERPLLYFGIGAKDAHDELIEMSEKFRMPLTSTFPAKGIVEDGYPAYLQSAGRVATKTANEAQYACDVMLWVGSDNPFGSQLVSPHTRIVQIDTDGAKLGKRFEPEVALAIQADAKLALRAILDAGQEQESKPFFRACIKSKENWNEWIDSFKDDASTPLRPEPIFNIINEQMEDDDIFIPDVGNVDINFLRLAKIKPSNRWCVSGKHATMGFAVPGALAAKLEYPDSTVYSLSGDGGFAMLSEEVLAQLKYNAPVINVVFSNESLGFIEAEQLDDSHQPLSGVDLPDTDWAKVGEGYGALGFTVRTLDDAKRAFAEARAADKPSVIDVKLTRERPLDTRYMHFSETCEDPEQVKRFQDRLQAGSLKSLAYWMAQESK